MIDAQDYAPDPQDPIATLGQRLLRAGGSRMRGAALADDDQAGPTGEPSTGATPNTKEPHQNTGAAAQGDSAVQSPDSSSSGRPSIGQRMLGGSNPTAGITAHHNDGSPAEMATGADSAGRPTISIPAATSPVSTPPFVAPAGAGAAPTPGQRLANFRPPPAAPQMNPEQAAVQQDLREHSQVTPKTDLATGKTLPQYKMGFGQRLLGSLVNFGSGFSRNGAAPINVGPGATNRRYSVDEANREQRVAGDQAKIKSMDDEFSQKEKGYGHELTAYNDEARAKGTADLRDIQEQKNTELQKKDQDLSKSREDNLQLKKDIQDNKQPKTYEEYVGALENEKDPGKKAVLQRVVDRLEKQKTAGKGPKLSAKDQLKLDSYMQDNKIDDVGDMTNADIKKALAAGEGPNHTKDRQSFEDHWAKRLGPGSAVEKKYDSQRQAVLKSYGADKDPKEYERNKADIEPKLAEIEAKREAEKSDLQTEKDKEAEQYQVYGKTAKQQSAAPAGEKGIEQPVAPVRTGAPAAKPSPATPGAKSISKAQVQALAQKHGIPYADAEKQFKSKNYTIQ